MAFLTDDQKRSFKPAINGIWTVLCVVLVLALAAKYVMSGYPPAFAWLEPFNELILSLGAIGVGVLVASNNPLIK
ncbi:MAG: hypothetical protein AAFP81_19230 [Pseudomonadota bacterium]